MPTRKQRRRREKERRHEWEYVYVDEEGREVPVEDVPAEREQPARQPAKAQATAGARGRQASARGVRKIDPPSWRKVARRGAIFAPLMLVVVYLLRPKGASAAAILVQVVVLLLFFLPFSYFVDSMVYRSYRKRIGDPLPSRERKPRRS
jgi:hypothetical protein